MQYVQKLYLNSGKGCGINQKFRFDNKGRFTGCTLVQDKAKAKQIIAEMEEKKETKSKLKKQ